MDVLFICGEAPTAPHHRPNGLIAALARRGHSVTLVFADEAGTTFDHLAEHCRALPVRRRLLAQMVAHEAATGRYDLAHVDRSAAALLATPLPLPAVLDAGIATSLRTERALRTLRPLARAARSALLPALRREEVELVARYERLTVATEDDAAALRLLAGADGLGGIHVVPCSVDLEHFAPPLSLRDPATLLLDLRGLSWGEAAAAGNAIAVAMTIIWAERGDARLTVLGPIPFGAAGPLAGDPRVVFTGPVQDLRGHLTAATVALAPVEAAGALQGPLEALATATPLAGRTTLARDLGATPGEEIVIGDTPAELAWAALALLDDAPFRGRLGRAGRRLAERRFGWQRVVGALETVYEAATGSAMAEWRLEVGMERPRSYEP